MNTRRRAVRAAVIGIVAAVSVAFGARSARAFTIASGFSRSCHERLGLAAMAVLLESLPLDGVAAPPDGLWRDVAAQLAPLILDSAGLSAATTYTDGQKFLLFSLVVGIRSPDTAGHSVANLDDLRREQIDPSPDSQHLHCLRAPAEDGLAGDAQVLRGSEALIRQALSDARVASGSGHLHTTAPLYLDFYGQLEVEVDTASYLIGRAMHTLQDCYAHTLRSADARTVYSVLNYVEAVEGNLVEARDGMAHSDTLDDCENPNLASLVLRATGVSSALAAATVALVAKGDPSLLDAGFGACAAGETQLATCEWMHDNPACRPEAQPPDVAACCSTANAYCGSPFLSVAREKLTQPYVKEVLACQVSAHGAPPGELRWPALTVLAVLLCRRRPLPPGRRQKGTAATVGLAIALATGPAAAEDPPTYRRDAFFAGVEAHASLLSDAPERSFINVTTGYGVRAGYRLERWSLVAQVERNYWLPTELSHALVPGALNIAVGAEWLALDGRVRSSATAGPSILWFDATFDGKGTTGLFADLRPAGLRWRLSRLVAVAFDPLSLAIVAPVLSSPRIVQLEYRTLLGAEILP